MSAICSEKIQEGKKIVGMIFDSRSWWPYCSVAILTTTFARISTYGSPLTIGFASTAIISETNLEPDFHVVDERQEFSVGSYFKARGFRVTHSVPDTRHYAINTPVGLLYHGSDFKLDPASWRQSQWPWIYETTATGRRFTNAPWLSKSREVRAR